MAYNLDLSVNVKFVIFVWPIAANSEGAFERVVSILPVYGDISG